MGQIEYAMLRDRVLDWIFAQHSILLDDDVLVESVLCLVKHEVLRAVRDERQKRLRLELRSYELN